jgi:hypothetical protein
MVPTPIIRLLLERTGIAGLYRHLCLQFGFAVSLVERPRVHLHQRAEL